MTYTDTDSIRRELAMMGQIYKIDQTYASCTILLIHKDGRSLISHAGDEADCLADIHRQAKETLL